MFQLRSSRRAHGALLSGVRAQHKELEDVCDAIVPAAIRRDIELVYVKDEPDLDQVGNIAALLRFRADQSKGKSAAAS